MKSFLRLAGILVLFSCGSDEIKEPVAGFSHTSSNGYLAPTSVTFKNQSTDAREYTWDFGDGSTVSNNINPIHVYELPGVFTVTLIAANGDRFGQVTEEIMIFALPMADFAYSSDNDFKEKSQITFENKSLNSKTYSWAFGDGQTSTEANPIHSYIEAGTYNIELTATNEKGSDVKTAAITIIPLATEEELQLNKLKGTWHLISANDGQDRTDDFPNLAVTIAGTYVAVGTYNYGFTGTRPDPSPWPADGTWKFGTNKLMEMIRDPGGVNELLMGYSVTDTEFIISFNVPDDSAGWAGGTTRMKSVTGDWTFTFGK